MSKSDKLNSNITANTNNLTDQFPYLRLLPQNPSHRKLWRGKILHVNAIRCFLKRTTCSLPTSSIPSESISSNNQKMKSIYVNEKYIRLQIVSSKVGHCWSGKVQDNYLQLLPWRPWHYCGLRHH